MRKFVMLGALAALLVPTASHAQFMVGLRAGFAPAMGDAAKDSTMSDTANKSQIPIQLDAAYKVTPQVAIGGYASYGFGHVKLGSYCDESGIDCSGSVMRFGVQGLYTFNQVDSPLVPWAGVGFGYEIGKTKVEGGGESLELTFRGFELLNLQAGGDYKVNDKFSVGPYLSVSIARYSKVKEENTVDPSLNVDGDIASDEKAVHEWFGFGIRGKFDL